MAVAFPVNGTTYHVTNLGFGHLLDNSGSATNVGNPILGWSQNVPNTLNQIVRFLPLKFVPRFPHDGLHSFDF